MEGYSPPTTVPFLQSEPQTLLKKNVSHKQLRLRATWRVLLCSGKFSVAVLMEPYMIP